MGLGGGDMKEGQVQAKGTAAPRRRQFNSSQPPESSLNHQDGGDDDEWVGQYGLNMVKVVQMMASLGNEPMEVSSALYFYSLYI